MTAEQQERQIAALEGIQQNLAILASMERGNQPQYKVAFTPSPIYPPIEETNGSA